jgi:site-specific DNA recombinase
MSGRLLVALYARVSSDHQVKAGTIESQIAALQERIAADGEHLAEDRRFIDAGMSGATLIRPQLERLRDSAAQGLIERLYVLSPDRLSRKYAHQALLMEELADCGVEVVFLNQAIGTTPEEELLLQMQGMIAEYERAKIMERNRRGKLHGAKRGSVNVLSGAPYGYRYIRKQLDGSPAQYVIDLAQAATVRKIFHWMGVERMSIGEVVRRLSEAGIETASGKPQWDRSVVWAMLQNPAYMGRAAFGKTRAREPVARVRPPRHSAETPKKGYSSVRRPRTEWFEIPVPALVSETLFLAVQEQLDENRKHARQRRRGAAYLLQGLTVCGQCHYAYYGKKVSKSAAKGHGSYAYYRCIGTDAYRFGGERICDNKQVRTDRLDDLVWQQVVELLSHPARLKAEYERRLDALEQNERVNADTAALERCKRHLEKGKARLIDSYTEGIIDKTDFDPKISRVKIKLQQIDHQIDEIKRHKAGQFELFLVVNRLEEFAAAVNGRLNTVDFNTKREIIRALIKRIEIHKDEILVVFRVDPDPDVDTGGNSTDSHMRRSSMQDRTQRNDSSLRGSGLGVDDLPVRVQDAGLEPFSDQVEKGAVVNPLFEHFQQPVVVHVLEEAFDVGLDDGPEGAELQVEGQLRDGVQGTALGAVAVATLYEVLLKDGRQQLGTGPLDQLVFQCRYP